jgi:Txe/YoeB family toxin of Txe-Axe toxin-antitoxin module
VISRTRPSFWRAYAALDPRIERAAKEAYLLFTKDPQHPSLRFKKLHGYDDVWSVRINDQYRAVGQRDGDVIEWAWIGSHNEFDSKFG